MANVTLNTVGTALSKVGTVTIAGITENGFTRTHSTATGYARVNPFEIENGTGPTDFAVPHSLNAWENYSHADLNTGSALSATTGYEEINTSWTLPAGYARDTGSLDQKVYWKSMGPTEDLAVNPFATDASVASASDAGSYTIASGLTIGHIFAIGVKVEWNDTIITRTNGDGVAYNVATGTTPLLGAGRGVSSEVGVFDDAPTVDNITQAPGPTDCFIGCTGCLTLTIDVTMEGPSQGTLQEDVDGGGFNTVDAGVPAQSNQLTRINLNAGVTYGYRLSYNDVAPTVWSTGDSLLTDCQLV